MSKQKKMLNDSTEKKVTNWKMHKRKKAFVAFAGVLAVGLGTAGLVYANAQSTTAKASLPSDTTVNWENNKPLYYEIDQTGKEHPKPMLNLGDGTPAWCLGLGVPLPNNTTQAQLDSTNAILNALSDEQIAVLNNVDYLAQKDGSLLAYAQAQHATYMLLDEAGVSINQTKDLVIKDNTLLHDANAIKTGATDLIKQAKKMRELPSFTNTTVDLVQGVEKSLTDTKDVMANFPNLKVNLKGLSESVSGNVLKLKADISSKIGLNSNALQYWNVASFDNLPYFVYSTDGDSTGKTSQSVIASQDPSKALGALNVNIIGLGEATLTKTDADTGSGETQGSAQLKGAVFGLFNKADNSPVKWSDGQNGYPIALTAGTKADNTNISIKLGDDLKAGVKNLNNSKEYYWKETVAPEGYSLSTEKYEVKFDSSSKFDDKTSNYIDNDKATDKVLDFNFGFIKAQDVNGSLTGLNGRTFRYTPTGYTKGKPIEVTSGANEDSSGVTNNGQVNFTKIPFGNGVLEELPQDDDKLQLINPISIVTTTNKDKDGNISGYTVTFTDTVTKQVITTLNVSLDKVTDNSTMFKVNLGTLVDKPVTPVVPTIETQAHSKDGDQTLQVNEVSENTPMYDIANYTNIQKGDQIITYLHRHLVDKDGNISNDKVVKTINWVADDETVQTQKHRFDTTSDTTKDFEVPEGSKVEYVYTSYIFDKDADTAKDEPKAKHDDLKNQKQTITVEKVTPSIDIEKANDKVPDAGNGNHTDKDNNIGVNDHDTEDTYFEVKENAKTKIFFRGTNNGTEPLTHVKVVDKTTNGKVDVKGITYTYNGKKLTINKDGEFELDGKLLVLNPKESIIGSGELGALPSGELHGDKATITGIGVYSKKPVGDDDKWYGKVVKVTPTSTTPSSVTPKGSLPTTGSSTGDAIAYGGMVILLGAIGGAVYYMKKKKSTKEEG
ncbi:SpaA isopeptide-forming pilin-related protein [Lactococcus lactis]|uniref:SpaA isopeptide-forming pilin-related protein n=1 Tax=Lactococcus lactis TaxID=1358 RepID=UPI001374781B|nr:SpaA isopeptide-forming pilin-related protein [Lactococcus lactis]